MKSCRLIANYQTKQNWLANTIIRISRKEKEDKRFRPKIQDVARIEISQDIASTKVANERDILADRFESTQLFRFSRPTKRPNIETTSFAKIPECIVRKYLSKRLQFSRGIKRGSDKYKKTRKNETPNIRKGSIIMAAIINDSYRLHSLLS